MDFLETIRTLWTPLNDGEELPPVVGPDLSYEDRPQATQPLNAIPNLIILAQFDKLLLMVRLVALYEIAVKAVSSKL